ncbi:hypothetical protein XENTR_v10021300 [Xenopus tropicalis]|uniref:Suppressor APC domain-containing protein 1 isoform X2 n=1 Tax=Xenopus tropicalis TaxID=8364 RepID=A0A8J1IPC1_XENTR|nr:suppressor APC domain-containing protein 1 isoform X2 [Xenopus tropicalis]KAE8585396.1 hypothetical protein XENTR_v10021300 [Xenopus tropicalis]
MQERKRRARREYQEKDRVYFHNRKFICSMAVAAYTILILPLQSSREALTFYLWLRRMKELEQERDALLDGLQLVDKAREWYRDKLREAEQHKKLQCDMDLPMVPPPPLLGSSLMVQIQEVNRFLSYLISPPEKVSRRHPSCTTTTCDTLNTLKYQNELLNRELSMQSERLWKLQRENTALYRELEERHPPRATFI